MNWDQLFFLRHEILLSLLIVFELVADLSDSSARQSLVNTTIVLFAGLTVAGFIPLANEASLFGGMYASDDLRILLKNILNVSTLVFLLQSAGWLNQSQNSYKTGSFYLLLFSTLLGMYLMICAGDFIMLYLGLELATIPLTLLAAYDHNLRRSAEAGIKLLMSSAVSSAVMLFGLSLMYGIYGSLHFSEMSQQGAMGGSLGVLALTFFIAGLGFKLSLVPFHLWTADVYEGSPLPVTMYFSVVSKGAALFTLMLVLYRVFGQFTGVWSLLSYALAVLTMLIGNLFALRQKNLKRFMAFSSITQAGFMMLGFVNPEALGMNTIIYFMLIYSFSNLAVFGVLSIIHNRYGKEQIEDLNGFYKTNPGLSLILLLALFSLAGIPPVAGFFGKFFLFTAAASRGLYFLVLIAVLNATISLYYYLLVVKAMFINPNDQPLPAVTLTGAERLALVLCVLGIVVIGFMSSIYGYIRTVVG